ncbi:MAG: cell wall hydrolase [Intestinimonas sp.]
MRARRNYRRRAWAQRIVLALLLAAVATVIIARTAAEPMVGEVSTAPVLTPQETAVLGMEPTYVIEAIPSPEPTPQVVARYAAISMTEAERHELAAIIYLEARGEPAEGQQAVAEVVFNRVLHSAFPGTVHDVLHDGEDTNIPQFSTIYALGRAEPTQAQYDAIDAALYGDTILDADVVFFSRNGENDRVWGQIGDHIFCREYIWG